MKRRPVYLDVGKNGISTTYDVQAENGWDWQCGDRLLPLLPFNPEVYGSLQSFETYDFYENMIKHGIKKNLFDTNLTR